ncbi:MAG: PRC-barrel domain-containing protein [Peptococcia bacterium]
MKKGREIRNLPVIDYFGGRHLGYVQDFKTTPYDKLQGLYIVSLENDIFYLPLEAIAKLGNDAVLVKSELLKVSTGQTEWGEDLGLTERVVLTSSGEVIGQVSDLLIEEKEGNIWGYEVTDGYLKDVFLGRRVIATADILTWGKDTVIVKDNL